MKEKLYQLFGTAGYIIYLVITIFFSVAPFFYLPLPFLCCLVLFAITYFLPLIGGIVTLICWIWSFVVVIQAPIDGWSIAFFIAFGVYIVVCIIPAIKTLLKK